MVSFELVRRSAFRFEDSPDLADTLERRTLPYRSVDSFVWFVEIVAASLLHQTDIVGRGRSSCTNGLRQKSVIDAGASV